MGFFGNQMRSVIEWTDPSPDTLIQRWDGGGDELKNASKLLINPGQAAIFVYEGEVRAVHDYPGMFELRTANLPFWTTISKYMQGFQSEHKAHVYFVRMTEFLNQKWGTKAPIKYDDPKYKFPVGLRAFGNFSLKIIDPRKFFTEISSNREKFDIKEISVVIVDRCMTPLTDLFAKSGFSYAEIDRNRSELSKRLMQDLAPVFEPLGFEMTDFRIENTDFDEDTKRRINKIADSMADAQAVNAMNEIGSAGLNNFSRIEQLKALNTAAANPGGTAGMGVGMGAGMGLAQGMMGGFAQPQAPVAPPPLPQQNMYYFALNNQQAGPFAVSALQQYVQSGQLTRETLVWAQGMAQWTPAGQVAELGGLFGPPPLPGGTPPPLPGGC